MRARRRWIIALIGAIAAGALALWCRGGDEPRAGRAQHANDAPRDSLRRSRDGQEPDEETARTHAWYGQPGAPARRIAGVVMFDGMPVQDAVVRLSTLDASFESVSTGERGEFDFGSRPAAVYGLSAVAKDREPALVSVDLRNPTIADPSRIQLILRGCTSRVFGSVRDSGGGAIGGAVLMIAQDGGEFTALAGSDGAYTVCVRSGYATVTASAEGYGAEDATVSLIARARRDFRLRPAATVHGRVLYRGQPAAGARVDVDSVFSRGGATSDPDGNFVIDGLAPGRHSISARTADKTSDSVNVTAVVGDPGAPVVCNLVDAPELRGRARLGEQPVGGVSIGLTIGKASVDAISQPDGSFVLSGLPAGSAVLWVAPDSGFELLSPERVELRAGVSKVDLQVARLGVVRGRVTRRGLPVHDALVYGAPGSTTSGPDGAFELRGWQPGEQSIEAQSTREGAFTRRTVEIRAGEAINGIDLELDLAASIAGRVIDERGRPIIDARVRFSLVEGKDEGQGETGPDGRFFAQSMSGGGEYRVEIRQWTDGPILKPPRGRPFPVVSLADGTSRVDNVEFVTVRPDARVAGRVVRDDGRPVPDVLVYDMDDHGQVVTDADGRFVLDGLADGEITLVAESPEGGLQSKTVIAPAMNLVFELRDPGRIEGKLIGFVGPVSIQVNTEFDPSRPPAADGAVASFYQTQQVTADSFTIRDVPAGHYTVSASVRDKATNARVEVAAGKSARVVLRAGGSGRVVGRFIDFATGRPIAGGVCVWSIGEITETYDRYVRSNQDGAFELNAPARTISITCTHPTTVGTSTRREVELGENATVPVDIYHVAGEDGSLEGLIAEELRIPVVEVLPDRPLADAGFRRGDRIIEVDRLDVSMLDHYTIYQLLLNRVDLGSATLTVLRGGDRVAIVLPLQRASD